jgi:hypothetical protein
MSGGKIVENGGGSMEHRFVTRCGGTGIALVFFLLASAGFALWAPDASAQSTYYTQQGCSGCHGATPTTCNGCHHHGPSGFAATTNKTSYAPGETVTVTVTGGRSSGATLRGGWNRAILYLNNVEVARSTGPSSVFPITFTATAPASGGPYTFQAAWYGNRYDTSTLPTTFTPDPNNPNHGEQRVSTPSFTVTAPSAITISTASPLPAGTVGTVYSRTLVASGGTNPYAWSISSGSLPAGLSLSSGGVLSGTPTATGTSTFTAQVTGGGSATKSFSLTINPAAVTLSGIAISGPASVNESTSGTYAATATWSDGTTTAVTPTWSTNLGTISTAGVLSAPAVTSNQTATLGASYTSGGVTRTASASVTIANVTATLSGIAISGAASVNESSTSTYTATATWSDGTTTAVTPTWSTNLGTISTAGVLSAPAVTSNQTAILGASYTSGGVTRTATVTVNIVDLTAPTTGAIIVTPTDGAADVPVNTVVTARVASGDIRALFNGDTFTLRPGTATSNSSVGMAAPLTAGVCISGGIVQGSISYNDSHTRARFTPNCLLDNGTVYIGEIASVGGSSSAVPQTFRFTTAVARPDSDNDGGDDEEDDHPYDGRRTSRWSSYGTGRFHIEAGTATGTTSSGSMPVSSGLVIRGAMAISDVSSRLNQAGKPEGDEFPDGLISFHAGGLAPGTSATFRVTFPSGIAPGSKVYQVDTDGFHPLPGAIVTGDTVTMTVTNSDNVDGIVQVNPVGVAAPASSGTGSIDLSSASGGGGCSVAVRRGSGESEVDGVLILAGLGVSVWGVRIRRRRRG